MVNKYWWEEDEKQTNNKVGSQSNTQTENKYWWDNDTQDSSSKGFWWDTDGSTITAIANDVSSRISNWINSYNSYITDHQKRFEGRKGTYEDAFVSDSADWANTVSKRRNELISGYDDIIAYLDEYQDYFDKDWMNQVKVDLYGAKLNTDSVIRAANRDNDYWNGVSEHIVASLPTLVELSGAQFLNPKSAYKTYQQIMGYGKKYAGKTYDELSEILSGMEDGLEKNWLTSYASSVDYDEKSKLDVAATEAELYALQNEIEALEKYEEDLWNELSENYYYGSPEWNAAVAERLKDYGGTFEGLGQYIDSKRKELGQNPMWDKLEDAKKIQELISWNSVSGNADFGDYSVYVDDGSYHVYPDYEDLVYDEVNNNVDPINKANSQVMGSKIIPSMFGIGITQSEMDRLDLLKYMTDEERSIYNYYYSKQGYDVAEKYIDLLTEKLKAREQTEIYESLTEFSNKHPWLASGASVLSSLGSGLEWLEDSLKHGVNKFLGKNDKMDYNDLAFTTNTIRGAVAEDLEWKIGNWDAGAFLYNTAMSGLDSLASSAFGYAGGAVLGLSAAAQATNDALDRGMSDSKAFWNGLVSGVFEGLFESISIGNFKALKEVPSKTVKDIAKNLSKSMLVNASEETLTEIANITYDTLVNGEFANYTMEELQNGAWKQALGQVLEAGGSGALMGLGMGSISTAPNYVGNKLADRSALKQYGNKTDTLIQEGLGYDVNSESYKLATEYKAKTDGGKKLTGSEIRELLAANQDQITANDRKLIKQAAEKRLTDLGQSEDVSKIAELVVKRATGQEMSKLEKSVLARSQFGSQVAKELLESGEYTADWTGDIGTRLTNPEVYNRNKIQAVKTALDRMVNGEYKSLEDRVGDETLSVSDSGKATISGTDKTIDLGKVEVVDFVKDKETGKVTDMVLEVDGKRVKASDIDYADGDQSYLYAAVQKIENLTPGDATVFLRGYKPNSGLSVSQYLNGIDEAYTYGYHGYSEADMQAGNYAIDLTKEQARGAYILGQKAKSDNKTAKSESIKRMRTAVEAEAQKAKETGKEVPKAKDMSITYNDGKGNIVEFDKAGLKLTTKQKAAPALAKIFHEMGLGTNFEMFESYVKDGVRVYLDENGVEQKAYSGVYRLSDGTIRIDLNAYNGRGLTLDVMAHELTHFIQNWSDTKYQALADFLIKTYEKTDMSMHDRVVREQTRLTRVRGKAVSYNEAFDEVVANAMSKMLADGKVMDRLHELMAQDMELAQKLWEGLKKFLKKFFRAYKNESALFHDANDLMELKDEFEQMQKLWAEAFVEASENFQTSLIAKETEAINSLGENAKVETNEAGELLLASNESGNVQVYSEHTYLNGGREKLEIALRQNGHTDAEIKETLSYVDDALDYIKVLAAGYAKEMGYNALSNHLVAEIVTNVKTGKQVMSAIVNNGDYPVNIDLSLICKKRVAYMNLMSRLIRDGVFDKVNYDGAAIAEVNDILRENGFETACLGCFVESRRLQFQTWAETIVSEWNAEVEKRNPNADSFGFAKGKMEELSDADIDALTRELESVKKNDQGNVNLGQGNSVTRMGRLLDALPSLQKKLTVEDLLTPEGLTALRKHDGSLFSIVKSRYGAASPKIVQDFNPYASEIAMLTFAQVKGITNNAVKGAQAYVTEVKNEYGQLTRTKGESKDNFKKRKNAHEQRIQDEAMRRYLYDIGGARIQSFSDFMIENIFDYIQIFADLSAKRLPLHGYTKEIVCLRLFGMTGAKWNGSLIAHVERSMGKEFAGLLPAETNDGIPVSVNGKKYVIGFDDFARNVATNGKSFVQSIGMKDIIALQLDPRYSPYVGNITIGVSDAQILAMLDSPLFRMVIPYHASGMLPVFAKLVGVDLYNDYTDYQNTTVRQYYDLNGKAVSELKNSKGDSIKADTSYAFNAEIQKTKDAKIAANNYLKWCAERHPVYDGSTLVGYATFNPKFSSSPFGTDFTRHENYYKLLEDFNTYDCVTGESALQGAVTMNFPSEANRLTNHQMAEYKNALRETGIFTEADIEKYAKKANTTFKEIIAAEVGNRADYATTQAPKWESTVKAVEEKLQKDYAREQYASQETDLDTETDSAYDGGKKETKQEVKSNGRREEVSHRVDAESSRRVGKENSGREGSARESCERRIKEILRKKTSSRGKKSGTYGQGRVELRETREAFENRSRRDGLMYVEIGNVAMALQVAPESNWNENAKAAAEKLAQYGFEVVVYTGELRNNQNGVTGTSVDGAAFRQTIFISSKLNIDGMETAYHESFHAAGRGVFAKHHEMIANIISSNVDVESEAFDQFVSVIADLYAYTVSDVSDTKFEAEIIEEFYAWYVGKAYATQSGDMQVYIAQFSDVESIKQQIDGVYAQMEAKADKALLGLLEGQRFSTQETDNISNRDLLANAFEGISQNSKEYKLIQQYKGRIKILNEYQDKLYKLNAEIRKLKSDKSADRDATKLKELQDEAKKVAENIDRNDKKLLSLEASEPLREIINREKEVVKSELKRDTREVKAALRNQKSETSLMEKEFIRIVKAYEKLDAKSTAKSNKDTEAITDLKAALKEETKKHRDDQKTWETEFNRLMREYESAGRSIDRLEKKIESQKQAAKQSAKNKKDRAEQTEYRHKIRKVIRDLDKLLNRGNKKLNVKEDMKGFVSKALQAAEILFTDNYGTYDMLRNGIGTELSDYEEALVKTSTNMLKDLDNMPTDGYDNWQARQEAENKLRTKMSNLREVFARERKRLSSTKVSTILGELADAYARLENSEQSYVQGAYTEAVHNFLKNLQTEVGGAIVKDMTKNQLESVYAAYHMVLNTVRNANKMFNEDLKQSREQLANAVIKEVIEAGGVHLLGSKIGNTLSQASWNNMKPIWVGDRIGSETFSKLMNGLFKGQYNFAVDIAEVRNFKLKMDKQYHPRDWDAKKSYEFESSNGKKFNLNLQQIMSLYAFSKRKQAYSHLLNGGFVFEKNSTVIVEKNGKKKSYIHKGATSYKLNEATLNGIINSLTAEQKAYVDDMQKYLSEVMGAKGNEVSMALYGVKMFNEQFYFPLRSSGDYMEKAKAAELKKEQGQINLANSGFTQAVKPEAKNPIILSGFMDVWSGHCNEMSMYHSMVLPMEDFRKVYNYTTVHDENMDSASVQQTIIDAYGEAATKYIDQLYSELNAGATIDPRETTWKKLISNFKKAAVMLSGSVVVQQFSSIGRAFAVIDPRYFVGAKVNSDTGLSAVEEMKKYAPVAIIKEMGGFDTGTKGGATSYIKAEQYHGMREGIKGFFTDKQYRGDIMGALPAWADEKTWCAIWEAAKRETKAKHPDMDVKSDEFLKMAGNLCSEAIEKTQVYDSVLARSANMRSKGAFMNMATAFMAEPITTVNLIENAIRSGKAKNIARAFGSVAVSIILNNALASIVYAMRDDDEDEMFIEKYFQSFTSGMIDDINPMTYYPFLKDVWSLFQGYDVERTDMSVIADVRDALKQVYALLSKDTSDMTDYQLAEHNKNLWGALLSVLDAGCSAFGVPAKNVRRDAKGIINAWNTVSKDVSSERNFTWNSFWDNVGSAAKDAVPFLAWTKDKPKTDKLYEAIASGDKAYVERLKSTYVDKDGNFDKSKYDTAVRKALRENDPRIHEAAQAYYDGNLEEYKRIVKAVRKDDKWNLIGYDNTIESIMSEVSKIKGELEPDKESSEYSATDFVNAILVGDASTAGAMKDSIIAFKVSNGMTQKEAEESFASSVASSTRNAYDTGLLDEAGAKNMLMEYADKDEEEAASKVNYWSFMKKHPGYDLTESNVNDYQEFAEPAGISLDVFLRYVNGTKGLATKYDDWGDVELSVRDQVIEVIDSLPLTWQQKDALYLAHGYAESKIWDVPW